MRAVESVALKPDWHRIDPPDRRTLATPLAWRIFSARRTAFGVPSLADQGLNVVLSNWRGVFGAPGLDAAQQAALREAVLKATQHASWKDALQRNSWQPAWQIGPEFQASLDFDQSMARVVVHLLKLKPA